MRVLVAGIGNIFFGDDGFGVAVADRLAERRLPDGVHVGEYGIRGVHLAYELLDGYDALVLLDAMPMGEAPGTVALVEVDMDDRTTSLDAGIDAHTMTPAAVLGALAHLGGHVRRVLVVAAEPGDLGPGIGLSPPVAGAVDRAVDEVLMALERLALETVGKEP